MPGEWARGGMTELEYHHFEILKLTDLGIKHK